MRRVRRMRLGRDASSVHRTGGRVQTRSHRCRTRTLARAALLGLAVATLGTAAAADEVEEAYLASRKAVEAGDLEAATRFASRALRLARDTRAPDDPVIGTLAQNAGTLLLGEGRTQDGVEAFEVALRNRERIHGRRSPELSGPLRALATAQIQNGETAAARRTHERRCDLVADTAGTRSVAWGDALRDAGTMEMEAGEGRRARRLFERAIEAYESAGEEGELLGRAKLELGFAMLRADPRALAVRKRASEEIRSGLLLLEHAFGMGSEELIAIYEQLARRLERTAHAGADSRLVELVDKRLGRHRAARKRRELRRDLGR